ncbi:MAG: TetR/AcrR family transcriptional regulator [Ilumatobacteraceae bacterium]|nr:TetR/AcrR family transcriptional regulator [Ilumatobacteraceae bacterium]
MARRDLSEATRASLLDAAIHEFAAHGFDGASTRAIATRAGVHQPQINYHFASKLDLWRSAGCTVVRRPGGRVDRQKEGRTWPARHAGSSHLRVRAPRCPTPGTHPHHGARVGHAVGSAELVGDHVRAGSLR